MILNNLAIRNTFKIYERLKREQHIDTLFRTGKAFSVLQLKFIFMLVPRADELAPARAGFSVPKKRFRKSVQRHQIRRLMVESWRLNKSELYPAIPAGKQLHLFIIYTGTDAPDFFTLQQQMQKGIIKLAEIATQHA